MLVLLRPLCRAPGGGDLIFAAALDGRLRAFYGVAGHGGSIDVAGVQAAGDMLYVQSGYGLFGQLQGNLLLAYKLSNR